MAEYNERLAEERHAALMGMLIEIRTEAKFTNGRLRRVEERVARLDEQVPEQLTDRLVRVEERSPGKVGGIWGAVGGLLAGFGAGWFR